MLWHCRCSEAATRLPIQPNEGGLWMTEAREARTAIRREMPSRSRSPLPFSPSGHPALSIVRALWRPPGSTTPSFADEYLQLAKQGPCTGHPGPAPHGSSLAARGRACTATSGGRSLRRTEKAKLKTKTPAHPLMKESQGLEGGRGPGETGECRLAHEQFLGGRRVPRLIVRT